MTQLDTAREIYPGVADGDFETYAVPATGHAINFRESMFLAPPPTLFLRVNGGPEYGLRLTEIRPNCLRRVSADHRVRHFSHGLDDYP